MVEKKNAALVFAPPSGDTIGSGYITDAGPTAAYALASFARDPLYFTGQYSSTPIDSNGIPGFEVLNLGLGVAGSALSQQTQLSCDANGDLYAGDTLLDSASGTQSYSSGATSVTITLGFNGYRIRNAGLAGPYTLTNVTVICGDAQVSGSNLFQTPSYAASQFELGTADFSLTGPTSVTSPVATAAIVTVNIAYAAGFDQPIQFSVAGVPNGSTANMAFPTAVSLSSVNVAISSSSTPPGPYQLTITGTSGSLTHSVNVTFVVPPATAAPTFSPAAGAYSTAQAVTMSPPTQYPTGAWVVYYTTDGSAPTFSNYSVYQPPYSDPITVSATTTITAFAWVMGYSQSAVVSATYTIQPTVVSYNVLWGSESYNVIGTSRNRRPWQITGIQVVFPEPITTGNVNSLSGTGVTTTGFSGLGTNTLTWTISPLALGNFPTTLAGSGANALMDASSNALGGGTGFSQGLKILYGDFNDDGVVNAQDLVLVQAAIRGPYNLFADLNGDGAVTVLDYSIVRTRLGTSLP
jgi:hypothetical protein